MVISTQTIDIPSSSYLILIHPSASADASAVKSAGFFQLVGRILLESFINIICLTILIFLKGYLIGLYPKKFIFTLIKLLCIDLSYISCSACLKLNTIIGLHTTTTHHHKLFSQKGLRYGFKLLHGFLSNKNRRIPIKIKFGGPPQAPEIQLF